MVYGRRSCGLALAVFLSACAAETGNGTATISASADTARRANVRDEVYFGVDGSDQPDCRGGARSAPWRSLRDQARRGCIGPGTRVVFLPGVYRAASDVFDGRINLTGTAAQPVFVTADPQARGEWPVRFQGTFVISHAEHLVIDGIDFVREQRGQDVLAIGANHVTVRASRIRGLPGDFDPRRVGPGDCVKIAGGDKDVHDVTLVGNQIHDCPQDAIDITGRRHIVVRNNVIRDAWFFQIKGGAEDVIVDGNTLSSMRYGITGNGMDCTKSGIYCGSPLLPGMPVDERFQARNVQITNNSIRDIARGRAVDFTGWTDVTIARNAITNGNLEGGAVMGARARVVSVFTDSLAGAYCAAGSDRCSTCRMRGGGDCWRIRLPARRVRIQENVIEAATPLVLEVEDGAVAGPMSVCMRGNRVTARADAPVYRSARRTVQSPEALGLCDAAAARAP